MLGCHVLASTLASMNLKAMLLHHINISKNPVMHSKMNNIPIKYHFLQEHVIENNIKVEYVGMKEEVADIFTKPLPWEAFEYLRQRLRIISTPK